MKTMRLFPLELQRLLQSRLTWLIMALTVLSPVLGLVFYKPATSTTMLSMYLANPAIAGRVILLISFSGPMTSWMIPEKAVGGFRLVSGATPLAVNALGNTADLPSYADMFLGLRGGSLGETCILALLIGGIFLIVRGVIKPIIPVAFLGTIAVFALLVGQDPLFHLMAGGAVLGAFFMATDYVTSPVTDMGKLIFGIGCGLITMVIRVYGNYPEGVSFAILLMNILTPYIDKICEKRMYKLPKKAKEGEK